MGRALSMRQRRLLDDVLPRLAVPEGGSLNPNRLFHAAREVRLEIGFGTGEHLAHQVLAHPDIGFIGCEPFIAGVAALLARLGPSPPRNVLVYPDDARTLLARTRPGAFAAIVLLFPDPWPKLRHRKRRFINRTSLDLVAAALAPGGWFHVATDDPDYAVQILAEVPRHGAFAWAAESAAAWRRPSDAGPLSRCEVKARAAGRPAIYLAFRRQFSP